MSSYTQRRAHAQTKEGGAGTHPLAHSFRASWGPAGTLAFGSRCVRVTNVNELTAGASAGEEEAARQRTEAALHVHVSTRAAAAANPPDTPMAKDALLSDMLAQYKAAAAGGGGGETPQAALAEQHAWKLVAALFSSQAAGQQAAVADSVGAAIAASDGGASAALQHVRLHEALRAWLRLALWDGTAVTCAGTEGEEGGAERKLAVLVAGLQQEAAVEQALSGDADNAYLASILSQPAASVRPDLSEQLKLWRPRGAEADAPELIPSHLASIYSVLAGETSSHEALREGTHCAWPEGSWMQAYALALSAQEKPPSQGGPLPEPPPSASSASSTPPAEMLWHLLRLTIGSRSPLTPLATDDDLPSTSPSASWLRVGDHSLAWHLMHVIGDLLHLGASRSAARLHASYLHQLETSGSWHAFMCAHLDAISTGASPEPLSSLLSRLPLPDEPSAELQAVIDLASGPATLSATADDVAALAATCDVPPAALQRVFLQIHLAKAERACSQHRPVGQLRHHLQALRLAHAQGLASLADGQCKAARAVLAELTAAEIAPSEKAAALSALDAYGDGRPMPPQPMLAQ